MSQPPPATAGPAAATAEGADSCPTPGRNPQDTVAVAGSTEGADAPVAGVFRDGARGAPSLPPLPDMERHVQYLSGLPRTSAEPALAA